MLSRRWLVNGLLVLMIAILTAVGYRLERAAEGQVPAPQSEFDAAAVERIEIRSANGQLALQRQQAGWTLLEPVHWPADRASVERLFRLADTGEARPLPASGADLARLGLDPPLASVQLGETAVRFGAVNNIGERRYTQIDATLYLLPDVHLPLILQGPAGFIDRHLLPAGFEVASLGLPGLELRRDADGNWRAGERDDIEAQALARLVCNWQSLEPTRIGAYDDPRTPTGRIVAQSRDGESIEFLLLSIDPEIVVANPALGLQYHFRARQYDRLFTAPADENSD